MNSEYYIEYIPIAQQNKYVSDYLDKLDDKKKELDNMKNNCRWNNGQNNKETLE
ncbi:hypothetical protein NWQ33_00620 [Mycoplasmopsis cynos]|nr:hypothetical protein [Mycoplasmopsis cynos]